jgi:hypothetical protein
VDGTATAKTYGINVWYARSVKKTTLYLPDGLKASVERVAAETQRSEAEVMRAAIAAYTNGSRPRPQFPLFESLGEPLGENLAEKIDEILAAGFGRD